MRRTLLIVIPIVASTGSAVVTAFIGGRRSAEQELHRKWPAVPRSMADVRGLLDNLYAFRYESIPAFVPQSGWDDDLCAANAIESINWILGEERLKIVPAWEFERANTNQIRRVFDRERDFAIKDDHVIETTDRSLWISKLVGTTGKNNDLTSDRLYIIGYHYRETRSDAKIIAMRSSGGTLNSHLMLLVGRWNGRWWGYHMFRPHTSLIGTNPFRIDDLGETMPEAFDLIYLWEVKGTTLPPKGKGRPIAFIQDAPPVAHFVRLLGHGHVLDTSLVWLFGRGDHFPTVVDLREPVTDLVSPDAEEGWHGRILGFYRGIAVREHDGEDRRGTYGLEFECVELVNRFYATRLGHRNMTQSGHADSYFYHAADKHLRVWSNGSLSPPMPDDILVFDEDGFGGDPGHVAIVTEVRRKEICIVQQNAERWRTCLPLDRRADGTYAVGSVFGLPCKGWARKENGT